MLHRRSAVPANEWEVNAIVRIGQGVLTIAGVLVTSAFALQVYDAPPAPLMSAIVWTLLAVRHAGSARRWRVRIGHSAAAIALAVCIPLMLPIAAGLVLGLWLWVLGLHSERREAPVLAHFSKALFLFVIVDLFILSHSAINAAATQGAYWYTTLIREALGKGMIGGPRQIDFRLLVFTVAAVVPTSGTWRIGALCTLLQILAVVFSIPVRIHYGLAVGGGVLLATSCVFVSIVVASEHEAQRRQAPLSVGFRRLVVSFRIVGYLAAMVIAVRGIHHAYEYSFGPFSSSGGANRGTILFVNDAPADREEGGEEDITSFRIPSAIGSVTDFDESRTQAGYGKLATKLLPALGYQTAIKSFQEIGPADYASYDLVVLICVQNRIPDEHKQALYAGVRSGTFNLLVAGDHTDIRGVQDPFNDFLESLGVRLNSDSVFPFGQWQSQLRYFPHPVNGIRPFDGPKSGIDNGYSVGASLTIDARFCWPVLIAGDGFSDRGTPDAPAIAGLGDMNYTVNEVRGGQILAAERPLGAGTILAFGDTAFLQDSSVTRYFSYQAGVFRYLVESPYAFWTPFLGIALLVAGWAIVAASMIQFSYLHSCLAAFLAICGLLGGATLQTDREVMGQLRTDVTVLHCGDGSAFQDTDRAMDARVLADLLDLSVDGFVLATNAFDALDMEKASGIVLFSPQGKMTRGQRIQLLGYLKRGGRLLLSAGYYENQLEPLLKTLECRITPLVLGAGQDVALVDKRYRSIPNLAESWELALSEKWRPVLTCFGRPVVALRRFGKGRVAVFGDTFALLDGTISVEGKQTMPGSFLFMSQLAEDLFGETHKDRPLDVEPRNAPKLRPSRELSQLVPRKPFGE